MVTPPPLNKRPQKEPKSQEQNPDEGRKEKLDRVARNREEMMTRPVPAYVEYPENTTNPKPGSSVES